MIASVTGTIGQAGLDRVTVVVGGVGLLVHTTPAAAAAPLVFKLPGSVANGVLAVIFAPMLATAIQKALKSAFPRPSQQK